MKKLINFVITQIQVVNQFRAEAADGTDETPLTILDIESKAGEQEGDDFLYDVYTTTDVFDGVMDSLLRYT